MYNLFNKLKVDSLINLRSICFSKKCGDMKNFQILSEKLFVNKRNFN